MPSKIPTVTLVIAVAGLVLSVLNSVLGVFNFRRQEIMYADNTRERILVSLTSLHDQDLAGMKMRLGIEVANIGLHPVYIKKGS